MKKIIAAIITLIFVSFLSILMVKSCNKLEQKQNAELLSKSLPSGLSFTTLTNHEFTNDSLDKKSQLVIIFFNTECDFCQHEITSIISNERLLNKASFLCISLESIEKIEQFSKEYNPGHLSFIRFLRDENNTFFRLFGTNAIPSTFIYDKNRKLKAKYNGEVDYAMIIKQLNEGSN